MVYWWDFFIFVCCYVGCRVYYCIVWVCYVGFGVDSGKFSCICCVVVWYVKVIYSYFCFVWVCYGKIVIMIYWGY